MLSYGKSESPHCQFRQPDSPNKQVHPLKSLFMKTRALTTCISKLESRRDHHKLCEIRVRSWFPHNTGDCSRYHGSTPSLFEPPNLRSGFTRSKRLVAVDQAPLAGGLDEASFLTRDHEMPLKALSSDDGRGIRMKLPGLNGTGLCSRHICEC